MNASPRTNLVQDRFKTFNQRDEVSHDLYGRNETWEQKPQYMKMGP
jgi:hypothetical protein